MEWNYVVTCHFLFYINEIICLWQTIVFQDEIDSAYLIFLFYFLRIIHYEHHVYSMYTTFPQIRMILSEKGRTRNHGVEYVKHKLWGQPPGWERSGDPWGPENLNVLTLTKYDPGRPQAQLIDIDQWNMACCLLLLHHHLYHQLRASNQRQISRKPQKIKFNHDTCGWQASRGAGSKKSGRRRTERTAF